MDQGGKIVHDHDFSTKRKKEKQKINGDVKIFISCSI